MNTHSFNPGDRAHFAIPDGANVTITKYAGEGWYLVRTVPDDRELVADKHDLLPGWRGVSDSEDQ